MTDLEAISLLTDCQGLGGRLALSPDYNQLSEQEQSKLEGFRKVLKAGKLAKYQVAGLDLEEIVFLTGTLSYRSWQYQERKWLID